MATHLDTREAADYLHLAPRTLERWRLVGEGPPYRKFGRRALYNQEDLEHWAAAQDIRAREGGA